MKTKILIVIFIGILTGVTFSSNVFTTYLSFGTKTYGGSAINVCFDGAAGPTTWNMGQLEAGPLSVKKNIYMSNLPNGYTHVWVVQLIGNWGGLKYFEFGHDTVATDMVAAIGSNAQLVDQSGYAATDSFVLEFPSSVMGVANEIVAGQPFSDAKIEITMISYT